MLALPTARHQTPLTTPTAPSITIRRRCCLRRVQHPRRRLSNHTPRHILRFNITRLLMYLEAMSFPADVRGTRCGGGDHLARVRILLIPAERKTDLGEVQSRDKLWLLAGLARAVEPAELAEVAGLLVG